MVTERTGAADTDRAIRRRKRVTLLAAGATFLAFMVFPLVTTFTTWLDGVVNGIGVGYLVGFAVMVLPVIGAMVFCRWANRQDRGGASR